MRMLRGSSIAVAILALSTVGYLALSVDDPADSVELTSEQLVSEDRDAPAMRPDQTLEQAEEKSELMGAENTEVVFGVSVRKDRTCTLNERYIESEDGELIRAIECIPAEKPAEPYDLYDDETLRGMSFSDAGAAEALGKRYYEEDPEFARDMMLRAAALEPNNTMPLLWLADVNYSLTASNGEPALNQLQENYLLRKVADLMTSDGYPDGPRKHLATAGFTDEDFAELDAIAIKELLKIRDIQLEVMGETTVAPL